MSLTNISCVCDAQLTQRNSFLSLQEFLLLFMEFYNQKYDF